MEQKQYTYQTISQPTQAEFSDRGSKFLAFTFPVMHEEEIKFKMKELKKIHPKAVHYCFAFRLSTTSHTFRVQDDGEPSGSAGRPILSQIDSHSLTNILIVVIRYFGGVLLGVPGLINAYKTAAQWAIENATIIEKSITKNYTLTFDYTILNEVMRIVKHADCDILKNQQSLFCELEIAIPIKNQNEVLKKFQNLHQLKVEEGK